MVDREQVFAVSACLIGKNCKYNGGNNQNSAVIEFLRGKKYILVCPECLSGLKIPREPSEIRKVNGLPKVFTRTGEDITEQFKTGAEKALKKILHNGVTVAVLKERSPSCGVNYVYDGTFSSEVVKGRGIAAALFAQYGIKLITEEDLI